MSESRSPEELDERHMLTVTDLRKTFKGTSRQKGVAALAGVSLSVAEGEFFTLLGPSGCGKTTMLRSIAGLESPDEGEITVAGSPTFSSSKGIDVPASRRGLAMVFQSYAIWPHMDVSANVAFPLKAQRRRLGLSRSDIDRKVTVALEKVELGHLKRRQATDLSGGQQQRLALARALVTESPLTLLDEPLSNLDAKLREGMRFELKRLQRQLRITAMYVTHDQTEALAMSNRIAVMRNGRIEQIGKPRDLYERPASLFVADFIGTSNLLTGAIVAKGPHGNFLVRTDAGELSAELRTEAQPEVGAAVTVAIRPQEVQMVKEPSGVRGVGSWPGVVRTRAYLGEFVDHVVEVGGTEVRVRADSRTSFGPGTDVLLRLDSSSCSVLPADEEITQRSIGL